MSRRERRKFTDEFKIQMVNLYNSVKPRSEIIREYDLTPSAFNAWVKKYNSTGSFKACDNRTEEEKELIRLKKENQQLSRSLIYYQRKNKRENKELENHIIRIFKESRNN